MEKKPSHDNLAKPTSVHDKVSQTRTASSIKSSQDNSSTLGTTTKCRTPPKPQLPAQRTVVNVTPKTPQLHFRQGLSKELIFQQFQRPAAIKREIDTNKENVNVGLQHVSSASHSTTGNVVEPSTARALVTPRNDSLHSCSSLHAKSGSISKTEPLVQSRPKSLQKRFSPSTLRSLNLPPLVKKILEEGRCARRREAKSKGTSDDESDNEVNGKNPAEATDEKVIHSYRPLQSHKQTEDTEPDSQTFELKDASALSGAKAPQQAQTLKREGPRQPLRSIGLHEEHQQVARAPIFVAPPPPLVLQHEAHPPQSKSHPSHGVKSADRVASSVNRVPVPVQSCERLQAKKNQPVSSTGSGTKVEEQWKTLCIQGKVYTVLSQLGSGGSSKVYQVFHRETSQLYAVKIVDFTTADANMRASYRNEICLLKKLQNSEQVIKMFAYEYRELAKQLLVVLEKGDTDLASFLGKIRKSKSLHPVQIKNYWLEMLTAVAEIHKAGIIHSDLKPANFLFVAGRLKLIDFGISSIVQGDMTSVLKESAVGTSNYMAPEMFTTQPSICDKSKQMYKVKPKSDVWSLGCILYNLVYGNTPFQHIHILMAKVNAICNTSYQIVFRKLEDPLLLNVLQACLTRDPQSRPSIEELLRHPYITGLDFTTIEVASVVSQLKEFTPNRLQKVSQVIETMK